jgi:hypothetical protein
MEDPGKLVAVIGDEVHEFFNAELLCCCERNESVFIAAHGHVHECISNVHAGHSDRLLASGYWVQNRNQLQLFGSARW